MGDKSFSHNMGHIHQPLVISKNWAADFKVWTAWPPAGLLLRLSPNTIMRIQTQIPQPFQVFVLQIYVRDMCTNTNTQPVCRSTTVSLNMTVSISNQTKPVSAAYPTIYQADNMIKWTSHRSTEVLKWQYPNDKEVDKLADIIASARQECESLERVKPTEGGASKALNR